MSPSNPNKSSSSINPHKSPSMMALKMLGKKLLSSKPHVEPGHIIDNIGSSNITPSRRGPPGNNLNNSLGHRSGRNRSPSLLQKKHLGQREPHGAIAIASVESSSQLSDLIAHSHNPFVPQSTETTNVRKLPAHPDKERTAHTHHVETPHRSQSFATHHLPNENIVYNPYGLNPLAPNRPDTAFAATSKQQNDLSFYLHDGDAKIRMLPLPIEDPNDFLPDNMKQYSVHLMDNFVFDTDNKTIGSGGSCEVRKVKSAYRQKEIYALEKINMIYDETPEKFYKRCSKEFIIAKTLSHNIHICHSFYLLKVPTTTYTTRGWGFIMELGVKDLFQLIEKSGWKNVPINEKYCIFKQIAEAVKFCHDQGIAHRDLKPENVLLSKDGICKLADFGISDWYHKDPNDLTSPIKSCEGMIGSPPYTPPEVMYWDSKKHYPKELQKPYNPLRMDCYALGIILFTLVNNIIPFIDSCNTDPRFRDFENAYNNYINHQNPHFRDKGNYKPGPGPEYRLAKNFKSADASRVVWRLSDPNPETRYTMDDLFDDPWFQSIETCVEPDAENPVPLPELRKSTTQDHDFFLHDNDSKDEMDSQSIISSTSISDNEHTSNPFLKNKPKTRSMLEIAESPILPKVSTKSKHSSKKPLFTLDEEKNKKSRNDEETVKGDEDAEDSGKEQPTMDSILEKPTPSNTVINSLENSMVNNNKSKVLIPHQSPNIGALSISRHNSIKSPMRRGTPERSSSSQLSSSSSQRSIEMTSNKKKKVIHHHLDVQSTVTAVPSMLSLSSR
ncbi:protein kinase PTK2 NDAI_0A04040 [Naumovozyma dairenensis CBS 421]|uniref:non-specific serine/threonine protein kinase n=1 Tax=Naumovozyma dairenensis (strain ATCC 10597 / BCRC 20456 / CBS 421 / NBRC 0211 / NRRL Y-12639) TaxID=1071378 RepID=G0W423_NAUDC|nr:hypothetical protein NDAI_0A04040 [Naumovozyma dairenensis CBS 421]CCD22561.1 hypothetical protein NDAI_0A04040 [Naumovozyma dairenensis CBS 421]